MHTNYTLEGLKKIRDHVAQNPVTCGDDVMNLVWTMVEGQGPQQMAIKYLHRAAPSIKEGRGRVLANTPGEDALAVLDAAIILAQS